MTDIGQNLLLLELFHGPTLAFKEIAFQLIARLYDHFHVQTQMPKTILGATSGDTGGAALHAFRGLCSANVLFLFPTGVVSQFQQDQMLGLPGPNTFVSQLEGSFDDCQRRQSITFTPSQTWVAKKRHHFQRTIRQFWQRICCICCTQDGCSDQPDHRGDECE